MINNETKVLACVSDSPLAGHVADCGAWAALRLGVPLELLHVLERHPECGSGDDRSGAIGVDAQEVLLSKLSTEDESRARTLREQGRLHLVRLRERALAAGAVTVDVRQRYGDLNETVAELESDASLIVMGRHGNSSSDPGPEVERIVRGSRKPILMVPGAFKPPGHVLIAFDGGTHGRRIVELVAASRLLPGCRIDLLMSGKETSRATGQLAWAQQTLQNAGLAVTAALVPGNAEEAIAGAAKAASIDLLVMGGYSHSPLRSLLLGSRTTELLRSCSIPTLLIGQRLR